MNGLAFFKHHNKLKISIIIQKKAKTVQLYYRISIRTNCYTFFVIICLTFLKLICFYIQFLLRVCCIFRMSSYCALEDLFNLWTNKFSYIKIIILLSIIINIKTNQPLCVWQRLKSIKHYTYILYSAC